MSEEYGKCPHTRCVFNASNHDDMVCMLCKEDYDDCVCHDRKKYNVTRERLAEMMCARIHGHFATTFKDTDDKGKCEKCIHYHIVIDRETPGMPPHLCLIYCDIPKKVDYSGECKCWAGRGQL